MQISNRLCQYENVMKLSTCIKNQSSYLYMTQPVRRIISSQGSVTQPSKRTSSLQCCVADNILSKEKIFDVNLKRSLNVNSRLIHMLTGDYWNKPRCLEKTGNLCSARKHTSSLFVSDSVSQNTAPVEVDLQLEKLIARCEELKRQLKIRGIWFDVDTFVEDYKLMKRLEKEKNSLERERESNAKQMAELKTKKNTDDIVQTREQLVTRGKEIKEALKELQMSWWLWEEKVTLAALTLPNSLRSQTPDEKLKILEEFGEIPDMSEAECHVEFVKKNNLVKFSCVGPKAYYLKGSLASLEQTLIQEVTKTLDQSGFHPLTTPEIFRSLVAEGCGIEYKSENQIFSLQDKEEAASRLDDFHLIQGVSLMSFAAYLAKTVVQTSDLPYRLHTTGRQYTPSTKNDLPGLFGVTQSMKTAVVSVTKDRVSCLEEVYKLVAIAWVMYRRLNLASRLVVTPARDLLSAESLRIEVQIWAPSLKQYIKVAHISCIDDYVSRRLMCYHSNDQTNIKSFQHSYLVYGEVLDATRLIALMVEHKAFGDEATFFSGEDILYPGVAIAEEIGTTGVEDLLSSIMSH